MNSHIGQPERRSRRCRRRGAHTVEMALVLPVLLLIIFCSFEFGRANMIRNVASTAAYTGAREVIVAGATAAEAQAAALATLDTIGVSTATITVTPSTITPLTTNVRVEVAVPFSAVTGFGGSFFSSASIRGECELTMQVFR